jgi:DNA-binding transcriptional LysR family regulator
MGRYDVKHLDFDPAVLRSFIAGMDLGSFAKAASRVGRSTSAVSAQIHRLEEQAGTALFKKSGRHLRLTPAGETLLVYARRLIALNDEAAIALRGIELDGWIRLGMQEDFGESALPDVLGRFARAHPKVRIEAHIARNADLRARIESDQLDLALMWTEAAPNDGTLSSTLIAAPAMCWIGSSSMPFSRNEEEPLPLVAFDRQCVFQSAAVSALDRAGIAWRLAFTSPSLSGIHAATAAGLGVAVRTAYGLPGTLKLLDGGSGLPDLPSIPLTLLRQARTPTASVERLASIILESVSMLLPRAV